MKLKTTPHLGSRFCWLYFHEVIQSRESYRVGVSISTGFIMSIIFAVIKFLANHFLPGWAANETYPTAYFDIP